MKLNDTEKRMQNQLKKNIEIPEPVNDKIQEAYYRIQSQHPISAKKHRKPFRGIKAAAGICGAAVAAVAAAFLFCIANPVLARELPLVGNLFERLQNEVSFFGNFSDKAVTLKEPAPASENQETAAPEEETPSDGVYTKTDDGLTITVSEVYANDQAIYLTMLAQSEEPFPDTMMTQTDNGEKPLMHLTYQKNYSFMSREMQNSGAYLDFASPEGIFLDEHTYSCILRINLEQDCTDTSEYEKKNNELSQQILDEMGVTEEDLNDETEEGYALLERHIDELSSRQGALRQYIKQIEHPESFTLGLNITEFAGYKAEPEYWTPDYSEEELIAMSDEEWRAVMAQEPEEYHTFPNEHEHYWYEGEWNFEIPITIDSSQTEVLELNETNEDGIGLEKVVRTPYEITVYDKYEEGGYSDTFLVALDAKGNKLPYHDSENSANNFSIQDRDISTVDIYILDYIQYMDELKGEARYNNNENKPEEEKWSTLLDANALYHKTIHFDS